MVKEIVCDHYIGFVKQFMWHSPKSDNCENIYVFESILKTYNNNLKICVSNPIHLFRELPRALDEGLGFKV